MYCGGKDALQTESRAMVERFFLERVHELHFFYCEDGDHHFHGLEPAVVDEITKWASR